jgi:hypothetical protein
MSHRARSSRISSGKTLEEDKFLSRTAYKQEIYHIKGDYATKSILTLTTNGKTDQKLSEMSVNKRFNISIGK